MTKSKSETMTTDDTDDEQLTEDDIKRIAHEETSVQSSDGETVRLADLLDVGLEKRQAIGALGLIALGSGVGTAVTLASTQTASAQTSTGSGTIEIGDLIANSVQSSQVDASELTGSIVGRSSSISHLGGNLYVSDTEPSSPSDNDILFKLGGN